MFRLAFVLTLATASSPSLGFPNVCDLIRSDKFRDALDYSYSYTTCEGFPFSRPCARFSYYLPKYFIEVVSNPKETYFRELPGVAMQLNFTAGGLPTGTDDDMGSYSYQAHAIRVPFASWAFEGMPCSGELPDLFCFSAMSEHLGLNWKTGAADLSQLKFLAWSQSPKACLLAGAATSTSGSWSGGLGQDVKSCSFNLQWIPKYPPSLQPICTGWGVHFPRTGTVTSSDTTTGSLVIASRIKSLGAEVFQNISISPDEKWQMVFPQMSSPFREGQNVAFLRTKGVTEVGRLSGNIKNYLYAIWQKTTCKRDIPHIWEAKLWLGEIATACRVLQ
ncbi:MAG: hypothetical protein HYW48_12055 [Deltaproteobacteria bacterium]|nr:hypothetical protein [Deltaproteobacteria bacterium]